MEHVLDFFQTVDGSFSLCELTGTSILLSWEQKDIDTAGH
jgi:hypothetical protein